MSIWARQTDQETQLWFCSVLSPVLYICPKEAPGVGTCYCSCQFSIKIQQLVNCNFKLNIKSFTSWSKNFIESSCDVIQWEPWLIGCNLWPWLFTARKCKRQTPQKSIASLRWVFFLCIYNENFFSTLPSQFQPPRHTNGSNDYLSPRSGLQIYQNHLWFLKSIKVGYKGVKVLGIRVELLLQVREGGGAWVSRDRQGWDWRERGEGGGDRERNHGSQRDL